MNVLITGSTGFVGKNLKSYLNAIGVNNIESLDLRTAWQKQIKSETDVIIHLAGKAHDLKETSEPEEYYLVNYELTKKLYNVFLQSNARKFIFISSVKAAADEALGVLMEDFIPNPGTHYGKSKLMAEAFIQSQVLPGGKVYYILRPSMIHGPGNKGNLNLLYNFIKKGIPYPLAAFNNKRSFLSITNLSFVINELIGREDIPVGIYNVADDEPLSTSEVVTILSASLNVKARLWKISPAIIKFFAKTGDRLHLPLTTERLNKLTESYIVSNQKIKRALDKELPLSSVNGLNITATSFK